MTHNQKKQSETKQSTPKGARNIIAIAALFILGGVGAYAMSPSDAPARDGQQTSVETAAAFQPFDEPQPELEETQTDLQKPEKSTYTEVQVLEERIANPTPVVEEPESVEENTTEVQRSTIQHKKLVRDHLPERQIAGDLAAKKAKAMDKNMRKRNRLVRPMNDRMRRKISNLRTK